MPDLREALIDLKRQITFLHHSDIGYKYLWLLCEIGILYSAF